MNIANLMFGGKRGGVEQALVNYCRALQMAGHTPTAFIRRGANIETTLTAQHIDTKPIPAPYSWNPLARYQLYRQLKHFDAIILHGNRAGALTRFLPSLPPVIAVAHSRFFTPLPHMRAIITLTEARRESIARETAIPCYALPNMVEIPPAAPRPAFRNPVVIGAMGRLSPEKGFDLLLEALAQLHRQGLAFRARIGGDGAEHAALVAKAETLGIAAQVEWCGWVSDKQAFCDSIDIFCLPSRTDSFPITLLEAMAHGCPVVATDCGGPSEMLTAETGILTVIDSTEIANGLARLMRDPESARQMGEQGRTHVSAHFSPQIVANGLNVILTTITSTP